MLRPAACIAEAMLSRNAYGSVRLKSGTAGPHSQSCSSTCTPLLERYVAKSFQYCGSVATKPETVYLSRKGLLGSIQRVCVMRGSPRDCWNAAKPFGKIVGSATKVSNP